MLRRVTEKVKSYTYFVITLNVLHLEICLTRDLDNLLSPPSECKQHHVEEDVIAAEGFIG